jgi:DnaK suppressor protein
MLSSEDRQRIEMRLREERARALDSIAEFDRAREMSLLDETGELTLYRLHPADVGSETMEQEQQFLIASNEGRRLWDIDEALRRLYSEPERFGVCERCGKDIEMERLEVIPWATLCVEHQIDAEQVTEGD